MTSLLKRRALSQQLGCNPETVRYYENIGLIAPPNRSAGGHRLYGPDDVAALQFVLRSRDLGFSIDEVRSLLDLKTGQKNTCQQVAALAANHRDNVRQKLTRLKRLDRVLTDMISQCDNGDETECAVIEALG